MRKIKTVLAVLMLAAFSQTGFAQQNVTLPSLNGQPVSLASHRGKVVVLALGASWLPLSRNQALITNRLLKKYAGKDVVFYFVATDSTAPKSKNYASDEQLRAFATRNALSVPVLRDSDGEQMLRNFKVDQIPSFVLLNRDGKLAGEPFGGVSPNAENEFVNQISSRIDELL